MKKAYTESQKQEIETMHENVNRGAAWLDKNHPGWHRKIKITNLDMSEIEQCICGQIFVNNVENIAGYTYFRVVVAPQENITTTSLGFAFHNELLRVFNNDRCLQRRMKFVWELLAEAWIVQIEKRRAENGEML